MSTQEIESLRQGIDDIDRAVLELVKRRQDLSAEIGRLKSSSRMPIRDFTREKFCLDRARSNASEFGLSPNLAEEIQLKLIEASLTFQEKDRVRQSSAHHHQKALVIGGAGQMGNWFARFLSSQNFHVDILDPKYEGTEFGTLHHLSHAAKHDMIVIATPLQVCAQILSNLAELKPTGLIFDLASLKDPLRKSFNLTKKVGLTTCSVHPMFGPNTELLSGKHVILVDLGHPEANGKVKALFAPTMAKVVEMNIDAHDQHMAFLLGLSHAVNIAFFNALSSSEKSASRLKDLSSTTFTSQVAIASKVAQENPDLYYEIQALNPYGEESLSALEAAISKIRHAVSEKDRSAFLELMSRGREYFR